MDVLPLKKQRHTADDASENEDKPVQVNDVENEKPTFDFKEKTWKEDFVLIVENKRLHVTKSVLAHASPVFDKMFQAEFKEKNLTELELPGKKEEDVQAFLSCIYPNYVEVSPENVYSVLPLAEEYQVSYLKSNCETCLLAETNDSLSSEDLYKMLHLATLYNMPALFQTCIKLASEKTLADLHNAEKQMTIPQATKCMILENMVLRLQHKDFLEVLNRYCHYGLKKEEQLEIREYANWDGTSLDFSVTWNKWYSFKVHLLQSYVECRLVVMAYHTLSFQLNIDQSGEKGIDIGRIVGRIVIKPMAAEKDDIIRRFDFRFYQGKKEEQKWSDLKNIHFATEGYICRGKFDVELHILAERK